MKTDLRSSRFSANRTTGDGTASRDVFSCISPLRRWLPVQQTRGGTNRESPAKRTQIFSGAPESSSAATLRPAQNERHCCRAASRCWLNRVCCVSSVFSSRDSPRNNATVGTSGTARLHTNKNPTTARHPVPDIKERARVHGRRSSLTDNGDCQRPCASCRGARAV